MKQITALLLGVFAMVMPARACDVCGCSASNQYLGLLPKANISFLSFQYQYNSFASDHPSLFENRPNERAKDYYNTFQLWGRYSFANRVQLFGFIPYRYNLQRADSSNYTSSGLGDISLLANVVVIREKIVHAKWQQQLLAGGGLKLPTGKYTGITEMDKLGLPNMQPGSGSWDFIVNTNYTLRKGKMGLNIDAAYTITTPNREAYKYGNRFNSGLLAFYTFQRGNVSVIPQVGFRYEYSLHDYDNYSRKWLNEQSGGYMSFATVGVQAYFRKVGAKFTYQIPAAQHYSNGYVSAKQRIDAGMFILF